MTSQGYRYQDYANAKPPVNCRIYSCNDFLGVNHFGWEDVGIRSWWWELGQEWTPICERPRAARADEESALNVASLVVMKIAYTLEGTLILARTLRERIVTTYLLTVEGRILLVRALNRPNIRLVSTHLNVTKRR